MNELRLAKDWAEDHAVELAQEMMEWQDTAILRDGKLRDLARQLTFAPAHDRLNIAEHVATRACLEALVKK